LPVAPTSPRPGFGGGATAFRGVAQHSRPNKLIISAEKAIFVFPVYAALRTVAALALFGSALTACVDSPSGPSDEPFDAAGTSVDIDEAMSLFEARVVLDYYSFMDEIGSWTAGWFDAGVNANVQGSVIPAEYAGKTLEYDTDAGHYAVAEEATGVPANSVRFILYATEPNGVPIEPWTPTGHVDIGLTTSGGTRTMVVTVVADGVTYLSYSITSVQGPGIALYAATSGSVSNGTKHVDFQLEFDWNTQYLSSGCLYRSSSGASILVLSSAPRSSVFTAGPTTVFVEASGPHGRLTLQGTLELPSTFTALANGKAFATATRTETTNDIVGVDGQPLDAASHDAVEGALSVYFDGPAVFRQLLIPL
jgi:hypothetical protein